VKFKSYTWNQLHGLCPRSIWKSTIHIHPIFKIWHTCMFITLKIYWMCISLFDIASVPVNLKNQQKCPVILRIMLTMQMNLLLFSCRNKICCKEHKNDVTCISIQSLAWLYVQFLFLHLPHLSRSVLVPWTVANWASLIASFKNLFRRLFISSLAISCKYS
jgi:hypothetical protein